MPLIQCYSDHSFSTSNGLRRIDEWNVAIQPLSVHCDTHRALEHPRLLLRPSRLLLDMPVGVEAWITQIPPITRAWLGLAVLTSLAVVCPVDSIFYRRLTHKLLNLAMRACCSTAALP